VWSALGLLGTPLLALTNLSVAYALATPSCAHQTTLWLHLVNGASLALSLLFTSLAWRHGRTQRHHGAGAAGTSLIATIAPWLGLLASLVIAAQWFCVMLLSPCIA
jgi:hypothetical protein